MKTTSEMLSILFCVDAPDQPRILHCRIIF